MMIVEREEWIYLFLSYTHTHTHTHSPSTKNLLLKKNMNNTHNIHGITRDKLQTKKTNNNYKYIYQIYHPPPVSRFLTRVRLTDLRKIGKIVGLEEFKKKKKEKKK